MMSEKEYYNEIVLQEYYHKLFVKSPILRFVKIDLKYFCYLV